VLKEEADKVPGMRWDKALRCLVGYPDAVHVTAKNAHQRGLVIHGDWSGLVGPSGLLTASKGLRDYQRVGVDFLLQKSSEGCILADSMGLGKSSQAATAARALRQKTVIVCPNAVRGVWLSEGGELEKWWPAAKRGGLQGTKPSPIDPSLDVCVVHYEILHAWAESLIAWGVKTLILDEGHRLVDLEARRSKAARELGEKCSHRMMLTGTPISNRVKQFFGPLEVISPGRLGKSFFKYGLRYCGGRQEQIQMREDGVGIFKTVWKWDGSSNLEELNERLMWSPARPWGFMLRRTKSDVELELPPRTRQVFSTEIDPRFIAPIEFKEKAFQKALGLAAEGKFDMVVALVALHLEAGAKVVVGSHRRSIAEGIAGAVSGRCPEARVKVSHGGLPVEKRELIYKSQPDCLCLTFDSCKEGVNLLSYAGNVVIAELSYLATTLLQFENRFGRFKGQKVLIQIPIARGSADDVIRKAVIDKLDAMNGALGKGDDQLDADLRELMDARKESAMERLRRLYEQAVGA